MTVDVEDYFHVSGLSRAIRRDDWDDMEYRAEDSTRRLLALFDRHNVRATFFVLGWVARRSPALVREIYAAGHEIASHGMTHQLVYTQTPDEFARETRDSKMLLEDIAGVPVLGYRAASWSITRKSLWALDILADLGFSYDSSVFPIRHDRYGIPGAPPNPGFITTPSGCRLLEFPPSTVQVLGTQWPVAGGGYFRLMPYCLTRAGLKRLNRVFDQPFIFYVHPWEVDIDQPDIKADWISRFRHYTNIRKTESRLSRLVGEFPCTTVSDVLTDLGLLHRRSGSPSLEQTT